MSFHGSFPLATLVQIVAVRMVGHDYQRITGHQLLSFCWLLLAAGSSQITAPFFAGAQAGAGADHTAGAATAAGAAAAVVAAAGLQAVAPTAAQPHDPVPGPVQAPDLGHTRVPALGPDTGPAPGALPPPAR